jgi:hypothetical protein
MPKKELPVIDLGYEIDPSFFKEAEGSGGIILNSMKILTGQINATSALDNALRSMRKRKQFEQIVYEWPFLYEAALNIARWISPVYPSGVGDNLLHRCLGMAIDGYRLIAQKGDKSFTNDPYIRLRTFILVASQQFDQLLLNDLYGAGDDGPVKWPSLEVPIMDWIVNNEYHHLLIVPAEKRPSDREMLQAKNKLMYEVFSFNTLTLAGIVMANENVIGM